MLSTMRTLMIRFRGQNVIWPLKSVWGLRNQIYLRDPQGASKVKSSSETFKTDLRPENDLTSKVEFDFDCCVLLIWGDLIWGGQNTDLTYVYMRHARYTHTRACTCMCVHARVWGCLISIVVLLMFVCVSLCKAFCKGGTFFAGTTHETKTPEFLPGWCLRFIQLSAATQF